MMNMEVNKLRIYLGYLKQSADDLEIVSCNSKLVINHLKNKTGSEWDYAYVDVWEDDIINIERIPLDEFILKY